jgi:Rrf2 family protein
VALARAEGGSMTIVEIAAREKIPRKFLEQILLQLKNAGILASRRGKLGGYALGRPADAITFGEILRLIDGPIAPLPCLSKFSYRRCADCLDESSCEVRRVFSGVAESARAVLDRTSLADSLSENRAILPLAGK